jgi:hypothetical protein
MAIRGDERKDESPVRIDRIAAGVRVATLRKVKKRSFSEFWRAILSGIILNAKTSCVEMRFYRADINNKSEFSKRILLKLTDYMDSLEELENRT